MKKQAATVIVDDRLRMIVEPYLPELFVQACTLLDLEDSIVADENDENHSYVQLDQFKLSLIEQKLKNIRHVEFDEYDDICENGYALNVFIDVTEKAAEFTGKFVPMNRWSDRAIEAIVDLVHIRCPHDWLKERWKYCRPHLIHYVTSMVETARNE